MTEIELIRSPAINAGLIISLVASLEFLRFYRDVNTAGIAIGFLVILLTKFVENYCVGGLSLSLDIDRLGYMCNPIMPHIKGIGYLMVGIGLTMHVIKLKKIKNN